MSGDTVCLLRQEVMRCCNQLSTETSTKQNTKQLVRHIWQHAESRDKGQGRRCAGFLGGVILRSAHLWHLRSEIDLFQVHRSRGEVVQHLAQEHPVPKGLCQVEDGRGGPHDPVVRGQDLAVYQPPPALSPLLHGEAPEIPSSQSKPSPRWSTDRRALDGRLYLRPGCSLFTLSPRAPQIYISSTHYVRIPDARQPCCRHKKEMVKAWKRLKQYRRSSVDAKTKQKRATGIFSSSFSKTFPRISRRKRRVGRNHGSGR